MQISNIINSGDIEEYLIETLVSLCMNCLIPEYSDVNLNNVPIEFVLAERKLTELFEEIRSRKKLKAEGLKIIKNFRATNIKV